LDTKLTWKPQLENVKNKVYRAYCTCKETFSKIWGLKPVVLYWILSMVIRPILTCGSMVWWPSVRYFSRIQLLKIQTLACLAINGEMRPTTTTAMEVILGISALHVIVGVRAQQEVYRLKGKHLSNLISTTYGHIKSLGT
jgi:hypothetical protein